MATTGLVVWCVHAALAVLLAVHSATYLGLAIARLRLRPPNTHAPLATAPHVTVQVAVRDEPGPLGGCIDAIAGLAWPRDRLEVQILDDSKDPAAGAACADRLRALGIDAKHVRRSGTEGEKAGALQNGLALANAEIVVPFDVDFRPRPDFLRRILAPLQRAEVACVQARWSTQNASTNPLTRALDLAMVGHFRVEQTVRAHHGGLTSFNATACAWRKQDILDCGGWPTATLTEDLDLATRVRLRGRHVIYLEDLDCPSEVPATVSGLAVQQARWARGSLHTFRLHTGAVLASKAIPARRKPGVLFHLGHYSLQPLLLASFAAQALLVLFQPTPAWYAAASILPLLIGPLSMYVVALWSEAGARGLLRLVHLPVLAAVGLGLTASIAVHALLGLAGRRGRFRRTPKQGARAKGSGHRWPALVVALCVAAWAYLALPSLGQPMAAGVLAMGAASLAIVLLR